MSLLLRRRAMMLQQPRLPWNYQEVKYLQSSGTQYIDTGVITTSDIGVQYYESYESGRFGVLGSSDNLRHHSYDDEGFIYGFGYRGYGSPYPSMNVSVNLYNDKKIYKNKTLVGSLNSTPFTTSITYTLFARKFRNNSNITPFWKGKIFFFKITNGGTLVRDFVPCYRKSDNVAGMYDLVTNTFYTNAGTGSFIVGPDINN